MISILSGLGEGVRKIFSFFFGRCFCRGDDGGYHMSPLQGSGEFTKHTRAFSPGYHMTGFQPCDFKGGHVSGACLSRGRWRRCAGHRRIGANLQVCPTGLNSGNRQVWPAGFVSSKARQKAEIHAARRYIISVHALARMIAITDFQIQEPSESKRRLDCTVSFHAGCFFRHSPPPGANDEKS